MVVSVYLEGIDLLSQDQDISAKLPQLQTFPFLKPSLVSEDLLPDIVSYAPVQADVVEWMQVATSWNAVLEVSMLTYQQAGGTLLSNAGDGAIPGVTVFDTRFQSQPASFVAQQNYAVLVTPVGNFNVPNNGKLTVAKGNFLAWAAAIASANSFQWLGTIARWTQLAKTPVTQSIGFPNLQTMVAPQFVSVTPPLGLRHVDHITLSSNVPQTVNISLLSPNDYSSVIGKVTANIQAGQSTVRLRVLGMGNYVAQIQPQDGTTTTLDSYTSKRF